MIMKNFAISILLLAIGSRGFSADNEKIIASKIERVTVFMQGAQVHRAGSTLIPKGTSFLVFDNISPYLNTESIQASGKGSFTIMDVQYRYHYPNPVEVKDELPSYIQKQINSTLDSIEHNRLLTASLRERQKAVATEKSVLMNHPLLRGQGKVDSLELLKDLVAYLEKQLLDIAHRELRLSFEDMSLTKQSTDLHQRLAVLQNYNSNKPKPLPEAPKHQIVVMVNAATAVNGLVEVNYAVTNAGWNPWYDIKAKSSTDGIELTYKAAVYQQTEEDWKDVKLTISNANPLRSNIKPILPSWYVNFYTHLKQKNLSKPQATYYQEDVSADDVSMVETKDAEMAYDYAERQQNFTSVEFEIDLPYQIESTGKAHFVAIAQHKLKATFEHFLVPKLDNDAFVIAHITDWESLDLLTGNANLYFGNTFVGRTVLDPALVSDTLALSMGRDQTIGVKRTRLKSDTKTKIIGTNKEYIATYQIDVRNNGSGTVELSLEDQIPMAGDAKIEIELLKSDGGVLNETTGLMTWKMKIEPGKKQSVVFTYKITYPKDQMLTGL